MTMANSRNNMFSVMAHSGFGECKINLKEGFSITLPEKAIIQSEYALNSGRIKKSWAKRIKNLDFSWMRKRGAVIN